MVDDLDAEALVNTYGGMVYNIAFHIVSSKEDAEDAYSETFLNYFRKDWEFETEEHRRNWFVRVATNCAYNILRQRRYEAPLDDELAEVLPLEEKGDRETQMDVRNAVEHLSPLYRDIIKLFYFQDLPIKEIAEMLSISENTVKSRLDKARDRLAELLS